MHFTFSSVHLVQDSESNLFTRIDNFKHSENLKLPDLNENFIIDEQRDLNFQAFSRVALGQHDYNSLSLNGL